MLTSKPRTLDSTIKALARAPMSSAPRLPKYVHCRIDPFTSDGTGHIPDGSNNSFITVDSRQFDTIAPTTVGTTPYSFQIQTHASLPTTASINSTTVPLTVNGVAFTSPVGGVGASGAAVPASNVAAIPLAIPAAYNGQVVGGYFPGANTPVNDPYASSGARLVAAGYRLIYTGPAFDCSGTITVTPADLTFTDVSLVGITGAAALGVNDSAAVVANAVVGTKILTIDGNSSGGNMTRDSITLRPEQGVTFIPKHKSRDYKIQPTRDVAAGAVGNMGAPNTGYFNYFARNNVAGTATVCGGVIWFDNDWSGATISVQNANPDATFRFESIWCMEYSIPANSPVAALTIKESPHNLTELRMAEQLVSATPLATPLDHDPRRRR